MSPIDRLTPDQHDQIPAYRDRWRQVVLSTAPLDREQAVAALNAGYAAMDKRSPDILFFSGPQALEDFLKQKTMSQLIQQLGLPLFPLPLITDLSRELRSQLSESLLADLAQQLHSLQFNALSARLYTFAWSPLSSIFPQGESISIDPELFGELSEQVLTQYWRQQQTQLRQQVLQQPGGDWLVQIGDTLWQWGEPLGKFVDEQMWQPLKHQPGVAEWERGVRQMLGLFSLAGWGWNTLIDAAEGLHVHPVFLDFCFSVLNCHHNTHQWQALRSLTTHCGLVLTFENACWVFDRPIYLSVDAEERLHAEGRSALQFGDGQGMYAYQGVILPEKYGRLHPHQWQAQWLLEEDNAELRRTLIQGIGYARICQELAAKELDSWREYTLLEIVQNIDIEPIHLLKMTCPSTGYIHVSRIPPDIDSAREAVRWINWGVDPEEFAVET
ncbi:MAG: DUF6745 domain-containing protein [Thermosynechococcaceae cyanobacterium]